MGSNRLFVMAQPVPSKEQFVQGTPLCQTSQRTFLDRQARHALGALLFFFFFLEMSSVIVSMVAAQWSVSLGLTQSKVADVKGVRFV